MRTQDKDMKDFPTANLRALPDFSAIKKFSVNWIVQSGL
jgi:hypothetical protein